MTKLAPEWVRTANSRRERGRRIQLLCQRKHAFAVLPTGFGKSDIFGLLRLIMDKVRCIIYILYYIYIYIYIISA